MKPPPITVFVSGPLYNGGRATGTEQILNIRRALKAHIELAKLGYTPITPHLLYAYSNFCYTNDFNEDEIFAWTIRLARSATVTLRLLGESHRADRECLEARAYGHHVVRSVTELIRIHPLPTPLEKEEPLKC